MVWKEVLREKWDKWYQNILPFFAAVGCYCLYRFCPIDLFTGLHISDALTSVITAESIILSLFGVMLPLLASARNSSNLVQYFFAAIDINAFSDQLKRCIGVCFLSLLSCVGMFFIDAQQNMSLYMLFFSAWVGLLVALFCRSYRFLSLIISLLFQDFKGHK